MNNRLCPLLTGASKQELQNLVSVNWQRVTRPYSRMSTVAELYVDTLMLDVHVNNILPLEDHTLSPLQRQTNCRSSLRYHTLSPLQRQTNCRSSLR
jgi:hypothetical protein